MYYTIYALDIENHRYNEDTAKDNLLGEFIYLHGKLQQINGYDLIYLDEIPPKDGIYPCEVILSDGTVMKNCSFYYWKAPNRGINRGLVVLNSDIPSLEDAEEKYKQRLEFL